MTRSLVSRLLKIFSSRAVSFIVGFLATHAIVRILGPTAYVDYAFLLSALGLMLMLVDIGSSTASGSS